MTNNPVPEHLTIKFLVRIILLSCLSEWVLAGENENGGLHGAPAVLPNTWVEVELDYETPAKYKNMKWNATDGFCDSLYRSKTGSILARTGLASKEHGITPGFYSNAQLEWNLSEGTAEVIDVFEGWGGGSYVGAKLLPAFSESPSPAPRHTYDGMAYDSHEDAMYLMLGANKRMLHGSGKNPATKEAINQLALDNNSLWKFTFEDRKWHRIRTSIRQFWDEYAVEPYESHLEYWPGEKKLIFLDGKGRHYAEFDIASSKWAEVKLKSGPNMSVYGARSTWDTKRELWLFRLGKRVGYLDPETRIGARLPDLPDEYGFIPEGKKSRHLNKSIAYVSKHDVYIVAGNSGNDTFVYEPKANRWKQIFGGSIRLPNGYMEYDVKTDTVVLVMHRRAYKFRYVPTKESDIVR